MVKQLSGDTTLKRYRCTECGTIISVKTNHYSDRYPYCKVCKKDTVYECLEPLPEGWGKFQPWKPIKRRDDKCAKPPCPTPGELLIALARLGMAFPKSSP